LLFFTCNKLRRFFYLNKVIFTPPDSRKSLALFTNAAVWQFLKRVRDLRYRQHLLTTQWWTMLTAVGVNL